MGRRRGKKRPREGAAAGAAGGSKRQAVDLTPSSTLEDVQRLGKAGINEALAARGLKVGGAPADRAARLHAVLSMAPGEIPLAWLSKAARRAVAGGASKRTAARTSAALAASNTARDTFTVAWKEVASDGKSLEKVHSDRGAVLVDPVSGVVFFGGAVAAEGQVWAVGRRGEDGVITWFDAETAASERAEHLATVQSGVPALVLPATGEYDVQAVGAAGSPRVDAGGVAYSFYTEPLDHCETPPAAYKHLSVWLRAVSTAMSLPAADACRVYDPYFCAGAVRRRLARVGFPLVINENKDFYEVQAKGEVPQHDVLVTNPPYSGDNPERLVKFLEGHTKPWAALMPAYIADKSYCADLLGGAAGGLHFINPTRRYVYWTPRGLGEPGRKRGHHGTRGERTSPFASFWYCWVPPAHRAAVVAALQAGAGEDFAVSTDVPTRWEEDGK